MNADRWQLVSRLFEEGVDRSAADRHAMLRRTARSDPELARELEHLFAANDESDSFLETPATEARELLAATAGKPRCIGSYELLRELATGSTSVVYEAEHRVSKHRVALKVSLGGAYLSKRRAALIQREMQILGRLNHPGIARLYDAGCDEAGLHYFAMELVEGQPLTLYAREHRLSLVERLRMVIDACAAVGYAHHHGIIHRDLKPANILAHAAGATAHPPRMRPVIKLLDFGVARITRTDLALATVVTSQAEIVGTLAYMSPEQAAGGGDLDARTDIYSIGVILYELVTGRLPHEIGQLSPAAAYREICEGRIRTPRQLGCALEPRLETLVMRCLEKRRERRPASTDELTEELRRCSRDSRRTTMRRSSCRAARSPRRRVVATTLAAGALALAAGAAWMTLGRTDTRTPRLSDNAVVGAALPVGEAHTARPDPGETATALCEEALEAHAQGLALTAQRKLTAAAAALLAIPASEPMERADVAETLSDALAQTGNLAEAEHFAQQAVVTWRTQPSAPSERLVASIRRLADLAEARDRPQRAERLDRDALRVLDSSGTPDPAIRSEILVKIALLESRRGDHDRAVATASEAVALATRAANDEDGSDPLPESAAGHYARDALVLVLTAAGRTDEAGQILERAIARQEAELATSPAGPPPKVRLRKSNAAHFSLRRAAPGKKQSPD